MTALGNLSPMISDIVSVWYKVYKLHSIWFIWCFIFERFQVRFSVQRLLWFSWRSSFHPTKLLVPSDRSDLLSSKNPSQFLIHNPTIQPSITSTPTFYLLYEVQWIATLEQCYRILFYLEIFVIFMLKHVCSLHQFCS